MRERDIYDARLGGGTYTFKLQHRGAAACVDASSAGNMVCAASCHNNNVNNKRKRMHMSSFMLHDCVASVLHALYGDTRAVRVTHCASPRRPLCDDLHEMSRRKEHIEECLLQGHLINHSCDANAFSATKTVYFPSGPQERVVIVASSDIAAGEEVTYNYRRAL